MPIERLAGGRVKGSAISARLDWVRDHASCEETIELFEALPRDVRQQVATVLPASWYEFATLIATDRAILALFGHGDLQFLEQLGAYSARTGLAAVAPFFVREGMHDFFRRTARLRAQLQDSGRAEYFQLAPSAGVIHHREDACCSPLDCSTSIGFYRECVSLHGGSDIEVIETECQCAGSAACTFVMTWR